MNNNDLEFTKTKKPTKQASAFQTKLQNNSRKMSLEENQVVFKQPQVKAEDVSTCADDEEEAPSLTTMYFDTTASQSKIMLASDLKALQEKNFFGSISNADHILMGMKNPKKSETLSGQIQEADCEVDFNILNKTVKNIFSQESDNLTVKGLQYWRSNDSKQKFFQKKKQQDQDQKKNVYIPTKDHTFLVYVKTDLCFKFDPDKSCFVYRSQSESKKEYDLDKTVSLQILEEIVKQQQQLN